VDTAGGWPGRVDRGDGFIRGWASTRLIQMSSHRVIDTSGGITKSGTHLVIGDSNVTSTTQRWIVQLSLSSNAADGTNITHSIDGQCVNTGSAGDLVQIESCVPGGAAQRLVFLRLPNIGFGAFGFGELHVSSSGLCLDTEYGSAAQGAAVVTGPCTGSSSQLWTPISVGYGRYALGQLSSGRHLDTSGGSTGPGSRVVIGNRSFLDSQTWGMTLPS
jgi:hypothetical protein